MARLFERIKSTLPQLSEFQSLAARSAEALEKAATDGLTISEVAEVLQDFTADLVEHALVLPIDGSDKKQLVMAAALAGFDLVAPAVPLPIWLAPLRPLLHRVGRAIAARVLSGTIETSLRLLKRTVKP